MDNTLTPQSFTWKRLPNGNVLHCSGLEIENDGNSWQLTAASGLDFSIFTMMEHGLSAEEAKGLANLLIQQGASWATSGLQ